MAPGLTCCLQPLNVEKQYFVRRYSHDLWPVLEHLILAIFVADHYSQEDVIREEGEKRRPNELRGAGWKLPKSDRYTKGLRRDRNDFFRESQLIR